jgi:hypothetical protein
VGAERKVAKGKAEGAAFRPQFSLREVLARIFAMA